MKNICLHTYVYLRIFSAYVFSILRFMVSVWISVMISFGVKIKTQVRLLSQMKKNYR